MSLWRAAGLVVAYNDPAKDFQRAVAKEGSEILIVEDEEGLCGGVMVGHDGHRGWLYYLATAPRARGRGIGRVLVRAAENWLRARGIVKLQLMVRETNTAVVSFYEHLGLEVTPRVVMAKWLVEPS